MRGLLAILLLGACAEPVVSTQSSPIIGGQLATAGEYPTVVALEQGPGDWFCTGTLVHKDWVLTAAHCVEGAPSPGAIKIRLDDLDVNDGTGGMVVQVSEIHAHPGFSFEWGQDIALLKLATSVDRPVTPIHRTKIPFLSNVKQVGYGVTDDNGNGGGILRKLSEQNKDCALTGDATISNDKVLCFDPMDGGGCYGDSGGPTFIDVGGQLEVVGVTSGGTGQGCTDSWGIWTLVPAELTFLDGVMMAAPQPMPDPMPMPDPEPMPDPMPMPDEDDDDGGCSTTGGGYGLALALLFVGLRRRRR